MRTSHFCDVNISKHKECLAKQTCQFWLVFFFKIIYEKGQKSMQYFLVFFFKMVLTLDLKVDYFAWFNPWSNLNNSSESESAFLEGRMVSIAQYCLSIFKKQFKQILSLKVFRRVSYITIFLLINKYIDIKTFDWLKMCICINHLVSLCRRPAYSFKPI